LSTPANAPALPTDGPAIGPTGLPALPPLSQAQVAGLDDPELLQQCVLEAPLGSRQRRIGLGLSGMYCAACAIAIEDALLRVPGVVEVQVQAASQRARILVDPSRARLSEMVAAIQAVGYKAWPDAASRAGHERLRERRQLLWRLSVAGFCMMQVMMITVMQYVAGPHEIPQDLWNLMNWACWVLSLPVMLFSCGDFFKGAWRAARQGRVAMDTPVALGILATFVVSTGATFGGQRWFGHEAYFDSLTMFVTFLLAGRWLESRAREKVTQSLEALCVRLPEAVDRALPRPETSDAAVAAAVQDVDWLAQAATESVPLSILRPGDHVRVPVGQAFPADGLLVRGHTEIDESLLTGESRAVPRAQGQTVVAGSMNLGAPVWISIERLGPDTRYQQIVGLVQQAMTEKPGWMRHADRFAAPFLWMVLAVAAGGALVWQFIDPSRSIWVAVSVLVVTCPCALSLAAPSALLAAAGAMARQGVLVRHLDALEVLAHVRLFLFDKTGTLTESTLGVTALLHAGRPWPAGKLSQRQNWHPAVQNAWQMAASLATASQHPLSQSLVTAAQVWADEAAQAGATSRAEAVPVAAAISTWRPDRLDQMVELAGRGVEAKDEQGRSWRLGSRNWVLGEDAAAASSQSDQARVWVAARSSGPSSEPSPIDPSSVLGIVFDERFRSDTPAALSGLHKLGIGMAVLSGDQAERVDTAVAALQVHAPIAVAASHATPEVKLATLAAAQAQGQRIAVVGDGINDAPVLAQADVSIALDQGAALAQSQADLLVLGGRLTGLPEAVRIARQALRIVKQNLLWAAVYNLACIPLALSGHLPPWAAGLGMAGSSLFVVINALRLTRGSHVST
jgi:Cu2+-exporting ATPase